MFYDIAKTYHGMLMKLLLFTTFGYLVAGMTTDLLRNDMVYKGTVTRLGDLSKPKFYQGFKGF